MSIGKLRHRLALEEPVNGPDGGGGASVTWQLVANLWGQVEPLRGTQSSFGEQLEAEVTHRITLRYRTGLTPRNRLTLGTRIFDIHVVMNKDERDQWLVCQCREVLNQ